MATILEPIDKCLKCGGPVWDNRADKKTPKYPDFKCRDKACAEAFWLGEAKDGRAVPKTGTNVPKAGTPVHRPITVGQLAEKMMEAAEALQAAGFAPEIIDPNLDTLYKMSFTELKG